MNIQSILIEEKLRECETNHLLHLVLTFLTFGLWVIVWGHLYTERKKKRKALLENLDSLEGMRYAAQNHCCRCKCANMQGDEPSIKMWQTFLRKYADMKGDEKSVVSDNTKV